MFAATLGQHTCSRQPSAETETLRLVTETETFYTHSSTEQAVDGRLHRLDCAGSGSELPDVERQFLLVG